LGTSGLALHYANIINQIESVVRTWKNSWNTLFFPPIDDLGTTTHKIIVFSRMNDAVFKHCLNNMPLEG
jgi:hypothetical protein